eukprot:3572413-Amphidinium_carterae.1
MYLLSEDSGKRLEAFDSQTKWRLQLRLAPPEIQADHDVAEAAVRRNWRALEFTSSALKKVGHDPLHTIMTMT